MVNIFANDGLTNLAGLLFDTPPVDGALPGGSGRRFDWTALAERRGNGVPQIFPPLILAAALLAAPFAEAQPPFRSVPALLDSLEAASALADASARDAALALNPDCRISAITERLDGEALARAVEAADLVLDCTDRFTSRYAINAACRAAGRPLVSGAAIRFGGQLAVFDPRDPESPCYACLYPPSKPGEPVDDEELRCAENGVVAPLVGLIGSFQALEAVKLLSGAGSAHQGLSTFDGLTGEWRRFRVPRDPACPVCGQRCGQD